MKKKSKTALRRKAKAKARQGRWEGGGRNSDQPTKPTFATIEDFLKAASKPNVPEHLRVADPIMLMAVLAGRFGK